MDALEAMKRELVGAGDMQQFLDIVAKHYDLKGAKFGKLSASRGMLINNIGLVINLSGAKPLIKKT
jgi:hypothetical protein